MIDLKLDQISTFRIFQTHLYPVPGHIIQKLWKPLCRWFVSLKFFYCWFYSLSGIKLIQITDDLWVFKRFTNQTVSKCLGWGINNHEVTLNFKKSSKGTKAAQIFKSQDWAWAPTVHTGVSFSSCAFWLPSFLAGVCFSAPSLLHPSFFHPSQWSLWRFASRSR